MVNQINFLLFDTFYVTSTNHLFQRNKYFVKLNHLHTQFISINTWTKKNDSLLNLIYYEINKIFLFINSVLHYVQINIKIILLYVSSLRHCLCLSELITNFTVILICVGFNCNLVERKHYVFILNINFVVLSYSLFDTHIFSLP